MDTAINIQCGIDVEEDGSYFFNWAWTYAGEQVRSSVYEELLVLRPDGWILGGEKEDAHPAVPGQTYLGASTRGGGRLNPGENVWRFKVFSESGELLGENGGTIFAAIPQHEL